MGEEVFYAPLLGSEIIILSKEESHHVIVKRIRKGERMVITDGKGKHGYGYLVGWKDGRAVLKVEELRTIKRAGSKIGACIPLLKGDDTDFVIRTLTEIGVDAIYVFTSVRTIPSPSSEKVVKKVERWKRIIVEACKQSRRFIFPEVFGILNLREVVKLNGWDKKVILSEKGEGISLKELAQDRFENILFISGPEGGFDNAEVELAVKAGFVPLYLGDRILRARTAPIYFISVIDFIRKNEM